jgi:hypothetical protein
MRPLSSARVLICALVSCLFPACDNGNIQLPPGGPGTGGAGGGTGQGTAGNAASGLGGSASPGLGGNLPNGAAGSASSGVGGVATTGDGGRVTSGGAGAVATGGAAGGPVGSGGAGGACGPAGGEVTTCPSDFVCGNGARNICALRWDSGGFCTFSSVQEKCDGADLGGETCQSVAGFPTGTLGCSSKCDFDLSGCSECTQDPAVVRCGVEPTSMVPSEVALASNDSQVAIAWAANADGGGKLRFTLLTSDLDPINTVTVTERGVGNPLSVPLDSPSFRVAALPSGWVVAGAGGAGLFVHTFNAGGANAGRMEVTVANADTGVDARLIPRPGGAPLLVWGTGFAYTSAPRHLYAAVLSADGLSMTTRIELPVSDGTLNAFGRGAYDNGQFYVPLTVATASNESELEIARVSADGARADVIDPLPGVYVDSPELAAAGDELAVSYRNDAGSEPGFPNPRFPASQRLALSGGPAPSPVGLGEVQDGLGPLVAVGDGFVQVMTDANTSVGPANVYGDAVVIVAVPADGSLGTKHPLMAARPLSAAVIDAVVVGTDVFVAWASRGRFLLTQARP